MLLANGFLLYLGGRGYVVIDRSVPGGFYNAHKAFLNQRGYS
jgi:hypothetical protein